MSHSERSKARKPSHSETRVRHSILHLLSTYSSSADLPTVLSLVLTREGGVFKSVVNVLTNFAHDPDHRVTGSPNVLDIKHLDVVMALFMDAYRVVAKPTVGPRNDDDAVFFGDMALLALHMENCYLKASRAADASATGMLHTARVLAERRCRICFERDARSVRAGRRADDAIARRLKEGRPISVRAIASRAQVSKKVAHAAVKRYLNKH